jgi:hypothetical protein
VNTEIKNTFKSLEWGFALLGLLCPVCKARFSNIMWDTLNSTLILFIKKYFMFNILS